MHSYSNSIAYYTVTAAALIVFPSTINIKASYWWCCCMCSSATVCCCPMLLLSCRRQHSVAAMCGCVQLHLLTSVDTSTSGADCSTVELHCRATFLRCCCHHVYSKSFAVLLPSSVAALDYSQYTAPYRHHDHYTNDTCYAKCGCVH
eukprot:15132-Heterococcus_DN1.PRE.2